MSPLAPDEIAGLGFEEVVRTAPVSIVVVDASGQVIYSNGRARELTAGLGHEMPADLDGGIDGFHPHGRRYERDEWPAVRSLSSGEEIVEEEFFYALADGERLWMRCSSSPVRDRGGEIVAAVLAIADVTERKRHQERSAYLAGLLDNTEDAIVALDSEWFVTVWNAGAERLYGWTADEVVGRHTLEVARLEMTQEERTEVRLAVAEQGRWRGEVIAYRKDGAPVWVELITVAVRGARGEITGFLGIHREISERKRAEEALKAAQRHSETILESITDRFSAVDREWRYTYINERALAQARSRKRRDLTAEDILGTSCWEFLPELVGTTIDRELHRAMREQRPVEFEAYSEASNNWLEIRAYPSDEGLSIYAHDISGRRRAEEALREAQAQCATADRRLEDAREAERSRIARDLHDVALQGLTRALVITGRHGRTRDDEVHSTLQQVGLQLRAAIYDLRLDQEGERPFSDAMRELVELQREMAPGCEIILVTENDLPRGSFGRRGTEVLRIFGEALTNACRHASGQRVTVRVTGPETSLSVEVTDDGHGFDPDQRPPLLHGQGLRGMRERAERLGAQLDVRSDQTGTTVRLEVALTTA